MLGGQGAVRPYSQVLEEAVAGTKQLTVVVVVMEPTGMRRCLNYRQILSFIDIIITDGIILSLHFLQFLPCILFLAREKMEKSYSLL